MKLKALTLTAALIITPNLHAGKSKTMPSHQASHPSMHDSGVNAFLDQCIIVTGLLCCLPCAILEECSKKASHHPQYHKPQSTVLRKK